MEAPNASKSRENKSLLEVDTSTRAEQDNMVVLVATPFRDAEINDDVAEKSKINPLKCSKWYQCLNW